MDGTQRQALSRTVALINDKGGVGKTSLAANLSGQLAASGYRVLLIDLNRQANLADDLGYRDDPDVDDQGKAFLSALLTESPLKPVVGVRNGLDVVPGGRRVYDLGSAMAARVGSGDVSGRTALAVSLAPIASAYDVVIIDSPPENVALADLALGAARWVIMPTKSDTGGLVGMRLVAERFALAKESNPDLSLLGVVLFATGTSATAVHAEVRADVADAFGGASPLLSRTVRHSERVARDCRKRGRLAHELEIDAASQPAWWEALRSGQKPARTSATTASVSADYQELAAEILQILAAAESTATA